MFQNYLITALRNFTRHKLYSFINIAGLTVGLTCAIFIILFVKDQLSYDRWIPDTQNLYRVERTIYMPGSGRFPGSKITFPLPQAMLEQIPGVRARTRLARNSVTVLVGNRQFAESRGALTAAVCEHHTMADGYLPSPLVLATAMASRRVR